MKILLASPENIYANALQEAIETTQFTMNWDCDVIWQTAQGLKKFVMTPFNLISLSVSADMLMRKAIENTSEDDFDWDVVVAPISGIIPLSISKSYGEVILTKTMTRGRVESVHLGPTVQIPKIYGDAFSDRHLDGIPCLIEDIVTEMGGCDSTYNPYQKFHHTSKEDVAAEALRSFVWTLVD